MIYSMTIHFQHLPACAEANLKYALLTSDRGHVYTVVQMNPEAHPEAQKAWIGCQVHIDSAKPGKHLKHFQPQPSGARIERSGPVVDRVDGPTLLPLGLHHLTDHLHARRKHWTTLTKLDPAIPVTLTCIGWLKIVPVDLEGSFLPWLLLTLQQCTLEAFQSSVVPRHKLRLREVNDLACRGDLFAIGQLLLDDDSAEVDQKLSAILALRVQAYATIQVSALHALISQHLGAPGA